MIIVDLTQTIISNCLVHKISEKQLIKHSTFNTLLSYKKQFGQKYGNVVLAADSKKYWRKIFFPPYKGHRKHSRDKSDLDWNAIFEAINEIKEDIFNFFPYKIIEVEGAEADDVIASLCKYTQTNELQMDGLFESEPQPVMIISSDTDFVQLQKYSNVKQWSSIQKKQIRSKTTPEKYLIEHIVTGDSGDNIPNVLTSDDWAFKRMQGESVRQTPIKKTLIEEFVEKGKLACINTLVESNFCRNQTLIDFSFIPEDIEKNIIDAYENYSGLGSKGKLMNYFMKNGMKQLFANVSDF